MKKLFLSYFLLMAITVSYAQDKSVQAERNDAASKIKKDPNDTIPKTWKKGGLYSLNFNQAALSNWAAGGDNSAISLSTFLNLYAYYKKDRHSWDNTLDLAYGFINTTTLGSRKADDRIDLTSKYGYDLGKKWYLSTLLNFRSQFAKGYAYQSANQKVMTSTFTAPAYLLLSEGMDYKPNDEFSLFLSPLTARMIIVSNDSLSAAGAYGVDPGKKSKMQLGAFASLTYNKKISPSATYTGKLDLFSDYLKNPQNINLYWTNMLAVKVSKLISMNFSVDMIYDNNTKTVHSDGTPGGPTLQLKELMGIGMAYKF